MRRFGNSFAPLTQLSCRESLNWHEWQFRFECILPACLRWNFSLAQQRAQPPQMWCRANGAHVRSHGYLRLRRRRCRCRYRLLRVRRSGKWVVDVGLELGLVLLSSRNVFSQRARTVEDQYPFGVPCVRLSAAPRPETQLLQTKQIQTLSIVTNELNPEARKLC